MRAKSACTVLLFVATAIFLTLPPTLGCSKRAQPSSKPEEKPVVLDEGSTTNEPEYFVDDQGRVIYKDSRTSAQGQPERDSHLAPVFAGSQRIHPAGEDPALRESYITHAPFEAIKGFYVVYLASGRVSLDKPVPAEESIVNTIDSKDSDGRRQSALFVNDSGPEGGGPRGGMKVMLKEFPAQHAVQIVLTTLEATPPGLSPLGVFVTPEQAQQWADEYRKQQEEEESKRAEAEESAVEPPVADAKDPDSTSDSGSEEGAN